MSWSNFGEEPNELPGGCGGNGKCASANNNIYNTFDWLNTLDIKDPTAYNVVEVSFKSGARKDFYFTNPDESTFTGDMVVVEAASGYDVGKVSLSGELVRRQMKKKSVSEDKVKFNVLRRANERDIQKLNEARSIEKETMIKARAIARTLGMEMKIGDVEFQGDKRKATFYYTADGRVDFRELVKQYAREFRVKIEMRQIGARQEASRIGGISSSGRELCSSTWLSDFKSVSTSAARYQNIAINQSKLTGLCGRLKCCLNYELDTYLDALEDFPEDADVLKTKAGTLVLFKTDIFKRLLYYGYEHNDKSGRSSTITVTTARAKEVKALNDKGIIPAELLSDVSTRTAVEDDENKEHDFEDVTGQIELKNDPKRRKKKRKKPTSHASGPRNNDNVHKPVERAEDKKVKAQSNKESSGQTSDNSSQNLAGEKSVQGKKQWKKKKFYNKNRNKKDGDKNQ